MQRQWKKEQIEQLPLLNIIPTTRHYANDYNYATVNMVTWNQFFVIDLLDCCLHILKYFTRVSLPKLGYPVSESHSRVNWWWFEHWQLHLANFSIFAQCIILLLHVKGVLLCISNVLYCNYNMTPTMMIWVPDFTKLKFILFLKRLICFLYWCTSNTITNREAVTIKFNLESDGQLN